MQFEGFAGNAALKTALSAAFSRRRLPHTLLLQGEAGLGKRTLAQILARAAVCTCEDRDLAPCGVCPACIRAKAGSHPDIRIVTGSGKSNTISVASVDEVIRDAYKKPEEADINVYCIFAENPMPEITQNKLLKVIEEPPTGALFIFTVLSADALLPTIRSRAQVFTVRPPEESEAAVYVQNAAYNRNDGSQHSHTCRTRPACPWRKLKSLHRCTAATSAECFRTAKTAAPQKQSKWRKTLQTHSFPARSMTFWRRPRRSSKTSPYSRKAWNACSFCCAMHVC